jgi:DNA polymerase II small subunit
LEEKHVVEFFASKKLVVGKEEVLLILKNENPEKVMENAAKNAKSFCVEKNDIEKAIQDLEEKIIVIEQKIRTEAQEVETILKIHPDSVTNNKTLGTTGDFIDYFRDRFKRIKNILIARANAYPVTTIEKAKKTLAKTRIIGMVKLKKQTKNGHLIIELEDENDTVVCFAGRDSKIIEIAKQTIPDEVIAVDGRQSKDLFIIEAITWPELPYKTKKITEEDISLALISDIHIGSKLFMKKEFSDFISFLNGKTENKNYGKIKYLTIAGDLVDGIGTYPGQENDLENNDIYLQYEILCEFLKSIPEHIEVILIPGNHDASRISEPQTRISEEYVKSVKGYSNLHFINNPGFIEIHDIKVMMYHGASQYSLISNIQEASDGFTSPQKTAIEMLRRRLLNPIYGYKPPIVPAGSEMIIDNDKIPDVMHFGDIHKNGYADYRGTTIINSGCWQGITNNQIKRGLTPSPGEVPIYNMHTGNIKVEKFLSEQK